MARLKRLVVLIVLLSGLGIGSLFAQKQLAQKVINYFASQQIALNPEQVSISFLPLSVQITDIKYPFTITTEHLLLAESPLVRAKIAFFPLLTGQLSFSSVELQQAKFFLETDKSPAIFTDVLVKLSDLSSNGQQGSVQLSGVSLRGDKLQLSTDFSWSKQQILFSNLQSAVDFQTKIAYLSEKLTLSAQQIDVINQQISANNLQVNQAKFSHLEMQRDKANYRLNLTTTDQQHIDVSVMALPSGKQITLFSNSVDVALFSQLLGYRPLLSGNFKTYLQLNWNATEYQGQTELQSQQGGTIYGINIAQLIAQKVPFLNVENTLSDTDYQTMRLAATFDPSQITIKEMDSTFGLFSLAGKGRINLTQNHCDFALQATQSQLALSLPIKLYGDCHSPRYEISWQQDLKQNIRNRLKKLFN